MHIPSLTPKLATVSSSLMFVALVGCYGSAPPLPPKVALPTRTPGAPIVLTTKTRVRIESVRKKSQTCPKGHTKESQACIVTHYTVKEPVRRTSSNLTYGVEPLNYAQFKVMTDPHFDEKLERLARYSKVCRRANIPRWVGIGLSLAGATLLGIAAANDAPAASYAGIGSAGGGVASYALGYFIWGGKRCNDARAIYRKVDLSRDEQRVEVHGERAAELMKKRVDEFNMRQTTATKTAHQ
ncbi:MAG: hypothetical protein JRH20_29575 [Deltaproteobacteria bacterium]|nr:hypothetical protein [Deltaproteobacteria bacterium]